MKRDNVETIQQCRYYSMISGLGLMLLACVWGMLSDTTFNKDKKAFIGAHHQWTHAGEMFTAAAFCWQYMRFEKNTTYYIAFVAMWLAMFCNGAAYAIAAYSNDAWIAAPEKEWTFWSNVSFVFVPIITGPACFGKLQCCCCFVIYFFYKVSNLNIISLYSSLFIGCSCLSHVHLWCLEWQRD